MAAQDKKTFITYLCIVGAILIILNIVSRNIFFRWDLTDNKMYSLSQVNMGITAAISKIYWRNMLPIPTATFILNFTVQKMMKK